MATSKESKCQMSEMSKPHFCGLYRADDNCHFCVHGEAVETNGDGLQCTEQFWICSNCV